MELLLASNYLQTQTKKYWLIRHNEVRNEACFQTWRKYILFTEKIVRGSAELEQIKVIYPFVKTARSIRVESIVQSKTTRLISGAHTNTQTDVLAIRCDVNICEDPTVTLDNSCIFLPKAHIFLKQESTKICPEFFFLQVNLCKQV
jgi:hypothetical protein